MADENPGWRPQGFHRELWGCSIDFRFPIVKLLDYAARDEELERSDNPFTKFVLAHLKALETKRDDQTRYNWKVRLLRGLFERGLLADDIRKLLRLIDWVIELPASLAEQCREEMYRVQEENHMPYVTSFERLAKEEGREEGLKVGIRTILRRRFGDEGLRLMPEIDAIHDSHLLETILEQVNDVSSPEQLRASWQ